MNHRALTWLIALALSAGTLVAQSGQPSQTPRATGLLAGRVVDAKGEAIAGAVVAVRNDSVAPGPRPAPVGRTVPVRTNAEGRFVFTEVPAGNYQLDVTRAGWLPGLLGRRRPGGPGLAVAIADGQPRNDLIITMWRPAIIAGRVMADNGDPLVGVEVRAIQMVHIAGRRQMNIPQRPQTLARQITDDRGAYRFSDLMPGEYLVAVLTSVLSEPPGFAGAIRAANATPRAYYQTMTATGAAPIVFDRATGVAAGGRALVDSLSGLSGVPTTEDAWLAYPTTYHPSAMTHSAATIVRAISGEPLTAVDVTVRMVPTQQVSGVLTGPEGPAPWHAVHLVPADTGDVPLVDVGTAVTDGEGAFTFYGVPPGQYIARVIRVPWPGQGLELGVVGGTGAIPYISAFGRGPSGGPPAAPAEPLLHASQSVIVADRTVTGIALTLSEGPRVRGRILLEGTGSPPTADQWRGASISAVAANGREDSASFPSPFSAAGPFATPSLWPGKYLLRVNPPQGWTLLGAALQGRDISAHAIDVTADIDGVVITLTNRVRRVMGTVQAQAGMRASDTVVLMFPVDQGEWIDYGRTNRRVASTRVDETGTFSLPAPPDGEYFVIAIPDAESDDWQNPATLAKLATMADRFLMQGDGPTALSLRLQRNQ
ncbi:MAG TPA: carboxypeptidase-like regulatory domain-containing protein [Vicinamibacterales bacterium]|nr:carboxypeptidase-like regulatory domain-containing protein [Vicinamibacterales bacterium]